jgi:hypothetical protein
MTEMHEQRWPRDASEDKMSSSKDQRVKIRKNSLVENLYLDRRGRWVRWCDAAWFSTQQAAERFAKSHGVQVFGLFPCESFGQRWSLVVEE